MKVKILTEGGKSIGLGHLSRCSALYEELINRKISVDFIINGDIRSVNFLKEFPVVNTDWRNNDYLDEHISTNDYVIVDSYQATKEDYLKIKRKAHKLLIIDDNGRLSYPEAAIVNPSLNVDNIDYSYMNKENLFLGPKYVIVRSAFLNDNNVIIQNDIRNVLIMMGGTDVRNLTTVLIEKFTVNYPSIDFDVVINKQDIKDNTVNADINNIRYHSNINDVEMSQLMKKSDFAITAAGQSIYELMATKTPFLAIQVIENQKNNVDAIKKYISSDIVFHYKEGKLLDNLITAFNMSKNVDFRKNIIEKQRLLIDGQGTKRIIDTLFDGINKEDIYIRDAMLDDIEEVYNLSNEDYVRKYSINKEKILWKDHIKWYEDVIKSKNVYFYIVTDNNEDFLGQVRYNLEGSEAIISLSLSNKIRGKGLASYILSGSIRKLFDENSNIDLIIAFISEKNKASIKIFEDLGFIRMPSERSLLKYQLRRNHRNVN